RRVKAVPKGERAGSVRRQCEHALAQFAANLTSADQRSWNADLKIQSGSPIAPRISSIILRLQTLGFRVVRGPADATSLRVVIESFPSAAIWALGVLGCYRGENSQGIRAYKKGSCDRTVDVARRPLAGFFDPLSTCSALPLGASRQWAAAISDAAGN